MSKVLPAACKNCVFYAYTKCKRYPPVVKMEAGYHQTHAPPLFPTVERDDWCGEFKQKKWENGTDR
jgi:hypothetical protein